MWRMLSSESLVILDVVLLRLRISEPDSESRNKARLEMVLTTDSEIVDGEEAAYTVREYPERWGLEAFQVCRAKR